MRIIICRVGSPAYRMTLDPGPPPGTIYGDDEPDEGPRFIGVECGMSPGRTSLVILELQPAGKKRMSAEEFLRGYPVQEGYRFGPERLP
jgi:methionyl-tRNA formyltransferase